MVPVGSGLLAYGVFVLAMASAQPAPDYRGNCSDARCHGSLKNHKVVHSPVAGDMCGVCHESADEDEHRFTLTEEGRDLCLACHEEPEGKVVHFPLTSGPCTTCHDPHASDGPKLMIEATVGEVCAVCHEDVTEDLKFLHGPVAAGACTACHDAHATDLPKLLSAEGNALCAGCHVDLDVTDSPKAHVHDPVKQDCAICHNPHGGENRFNLAGELPELCLGCHDAVADTVDMATVSHDPVTTGKSCVNCHTPHQSEHARLLLKSPMALCLSCHDKPVKSDDVMLANIAEVLASNPNPHGPIRDQDCSGCHGAHGGEHFRMLNDAFPAAFYASYTHEAYALCFDCHDAELVEEEETDSATGFRNGEHNLHYLHVDRETKGRTCRACHELHASSGPKHIAETVPFGDWQIPINFKKTETGGGCQPGCHRAYHYDREQPIENLPGPPA